MKNYIEAITRIIITNEKKKKQECKKHGLYFPSYGCGQEVRGCDKEFLVEGKANEIQTWFSKEL